MEFLQVDGFDTLNDPFHEVELQYNQFDYEPDRDESDQQPYHVVLVDHKAYEVDGDAWDVCIHRIDDEQQEGDQEQWDDALVGASVVGKQAEPGADEE